MERLIIGTHFWEHDSAIFLIDPDGREVVALATERFTRYKHDFQYAIEPIRKLLEYRHIDPARVDELFVADSFLASQFAPVPRHYYDLVHNLRKHLQAPFIGEFEKREGAFSSKTRLGQFLDLTKTRYGWTLIGLTIQNLFQPRGLEEHDLRARAGKLFPDTRNDDLYRMLRAQLPTPAVPVEEDMRRHLRALFPRARIDIRYYDHHACHAFSSYVASPFDEALLITTDGWGDGHFSRVFSARNGTVQPVAASTHRLLNLNKRAALEAPVRTSIYVDSWKMIVDGSPAGIYGYMTERLGFRKLSDEGKVEALAAYGTWENDFYRDLMSLFRIDDQDALAFDHDAAETLLQADNVQALMGRYKREDVAAAVQRFLEDTMVSYIRHLVRKTGIANVCLSGGAAANVIMNLRVFEEVTKNIFVAPAMADDGTAEGAAIQLAMALGYSYQQLRWLKSRALPYHGTSYGKSDILRQLRAFSDRITVKDLGVAWPEVAAREIAQGAVGGLFHGRMEWGPRALGNRSIVADPRNPNVRDLLNHKIKNRPAFQPYGPSVLAEEMTRLFEAAYLNKHMTCAFRMKKEYRTELPGAIHVDGTARVQFVEAEDNPAYFRLLKEMQRLTGYGVVLNTSFNRHGRTIVESPTDAVEDFLDSEMDFIVLEGVCVTRRQGSSVLRDSAAAAASSPVVRAAS